MAGNKRWDRYRPPSEKRNESGRPISSAAKPKPTTSKSAATKSAATKPAATKPAASSSGSRTVPVTAALIVGFVVIVIVAVVVAVNSDSEASGDNPDIDRSLLTVDFIGSSFARATEVEGEQAVSVRLDEYGVTVEYFDPNKRQIRSFETRGGDDGGYTLRVEESYYDDYQPRPFDLAVLDPADLIADVDAALEKVDDATTFYVRIEADRETGEVAVVTRVSGNGDHVTVTSAP